MSRASSTRSPQPRWPAGTPVRPDGGGPGGGRFAPQGKVGGGVGMSVSRLREALQAGEQYEIKLPFGWVRATRVDREDVTHYETLDGRAGVLDRTTLFVRKAGTVPGSGYESVPDWAERISQQTDRRRHFVRRMMTHAEVASYLGRDDYQVTGRANGAFGEVEFRQYPNGQKLVYKKIYAGDLEEEIRNEVQASLIARALGAPVPAVVRDPDDPDGLLMEYIDEPVRYRTDFWRGGTDRAAAKLDAQDTPSGRMLGLLDLLIGNRDRHDQNMLFQEDGGVVGVDHGRSFQAAWFRGAPETLSPGEFGATAHFARALVGIDNGRWVQRYFSKAAILEARRRIEAIKDELDPDVWAGVNATLDVLYHMSPETGASLD